MMIAQLSNLASLEMPWCIKVTNIGLSALTPLTKLSNLNISGCQLITEHGLACLASLTNLRRLGLLNLGYSKVCVTDAALQKLSSLTKLESLTVGLNIGSMQPFHKAVTDASMRLVSSSFKQLTQLGLMSLDISDEGVKMLSQLNKLQVRVTCGYGNGSAPALGGAVTASCARLQRSMGLLICMLQVNQGGTRNMSAGIVAGPLVMGTAATALLWY
jgi:hypothetical protein